MVDLLSDVISVLAIDVLENVSVVETVVFNHSYEPSKASNNSVNPNSGITEQTANDNLTKLIKIHADPSNQVGRVTLIHRDSDLLNYETAGKLKV